MDATEDAASRRSARPGGPCFILKRVLRGPVSLESDDASGARFEQLLQPGKAPHVLPVARPSDERSSSFVTPFVLAWAVIVTFVPPPTVSNQ